MTKKFNFITGYLIEAFNNPRAYLRWDRDFLYTNLNFFEYIEEKVFWLKWLILEIENAMYDSELYIGFYSEPEFYKQKVFIIDKYNKELGLLEEGINIANDRHNPIIKVLDILNNNAPEFISLIAPDSRNGFEEIEKKLIQYKYLSEHGKFGHWNKKKVDLFSFVHELWSYGYFMKSVSGKAIGARQIKVQFEKRYKTKLEDYIKPYKLEKPVEKRVFTFISKPQK